MFWIWGKFGFVFMRAVFMLASKNERPKAAKITGLDFGILKYFAFSVSQGPYI